VARPRGERDGTHAVVARSDTTTDQSMDLADQSSNYPLKNGRMEAGSRPLRDCRGRRSSQGPLLVAGGSSLPFRTARELQPSRTCWARLKRQADSPLRSSCAAAQATSSPWSGTRLVRAVFVLSNGPIHGNGTPVRSMQACAPCCASLHVLHPHRSVCSILRTAAHRLTCSPRRSKESSTVGVLR
jgi:hypothetical protein